MSFEEIYCVKWIETGTIANNVFFTDLERAKRYLDKCNRSLNWYHKLFYTHRWVLIALKKAN